MIQVYLSHFLYFKACCSAWIARLGPLAKRLCHSPEDACPVEGILVMRESGMTLMEPQQALKELGLTEQQLRFTSNVLLPVEAPMSSVLMERLHSQLRRLVGHSMVICGL